MTRTDRPTLALCMIVRDSASYITDCLSSVIAHVDELCVVDTGSTDDTMEVIRDIANMRRGYDRPFTFKEASFNWETNPESFFKDEAESFEGIDVVPDMPYSGTMVLSDYAKARQTSFDLAESDYTMWIDSDDIVAGAANLDRIVEKMKKEEIDSSLFFYDYEEDSKGRVVNKLLRTRIVRRSGPARWENPIHEAIGPLGRLELIGEDIIKIVHRAKMLTKVQPHRIPFRNYKVLKWRFHDMVKNNLPISPRIYFYLGNESRPYQPDKAMAYLTKYVEVSEWAEEKCLAHVYMGQSYEAAGNMLEAESQYATAMNVFPKPEAYFGMARIAFFRKQWKECIHFHELGRKSLREVRDVLHCNPLDRHYYPAIAAGSAYLALGDVIKATKIVDEGLTYAPNDLQLQGIKESLTKIERKRHRYLNIVIHTGRSVETWNASTPRTTGLGGSETAVVLMSEALVRRGHSVTVFCHCEEKQGKFNGVQYTPYDQFKDYKGQIDIFISSRRPVTFNEEEINARVKILWVHDAHMGLGAYELSRGILQADALFCLSEWHKANILDHYPYVHPDKIVVTRNGIDSSLFEPRKPTIEKTKNKLIYSSSFDRGLEMAIKLFPQVRKEIPDAELHVFYGFDTAIAMVQRLKERGIDKPAMIEKIAEVKKLADETDGVFLRGRMGQVDLAKEWLSAKAWFYPTLFEETSCISAMEAQAAGCIPITTELGALKETVHHGFLLKPKIVDGKLVLTEEVQQAFVKRAIWCLTEENSRQKLAKNARSNSLEFHSWEMVAREWEIIICNQLLA